MAQKGPFVDDSVVIPSSSPPGPDLKLGVGAKPRGTFGIRLKMTGLMVAMTLVVVATLTGYFAKRGAQRADAETRERALVYAALAGKQLTSAVAFDDHETAREVLAAIDADEGVDSIAVYTSRGPLYVVGKPSSLAARVTRAISTKPAAYQLPDRVLATAPITSLEGAKGHVVLELSTRRAAELRKHLIGVAIGIGSAVLLLSLGLAWLLSRSICLRIERVASAAQAMAGGNLDLVLDEKGPSDEIGQLSRTFNAMSRKVHDLFEHIQRTAREESERLERLVAERTAELNTRNRDLRLVLDTVEQGFVTIDRDGRPIGERSLAIDRWLGTLDPTRSIWHALSDGVAKREATYLLGWEQVIEDLMPIEVAIAQLPNRISVGDRHLSLEYRLIDSASVDRTLLIISDLTPVIHRARIEQEASELVGICSGLMKNRPAFLEFVEDASRLVARVLGEQEDGIVFARDLHTLKGNAALFGLTRLSSVCHDLEETFRTQSLSEIDRSPLLSAWQHSQEIIRELSGEKPEGAMQISEGEYSKLLGAVQAGAPMSQIEARLLTWQLEPVGKRLKHIAEQLRTTAKHLDKGDVAINIEAAPVLMGRDELSEFWGAFSHVVRNAAVHGLEGEDGASRRRSRHRGTPEFTLRAGLDQENFFVELRDSGPGIDWPRVAARAAELGLPHASPRELEEALFADRLSTRDEVDDIAGRGVGLGAVRGACQSRSGTVHVESAPNAGTCFRFMWPQAELPSLQQLSTEGAAQ